ncbi:FAD dependent oxidoreductase [Colletotrichum scovillei]|uniref:FAD dependent oxidoreductase n=1 Tax=Colletotrichum scovillei TaxID=1209932 RepID=A0A9P7RD43_9PEZI|nr:FAD dependent oxidoreductase [Colletotrichum scovillei]KAG7074443.1 FAD dependent oxidoreductase [Colletotrichum scovillei]KAG7081652.1 FAD dependent oxidoreductase [Colletotrichum scovillei]
MLEACDGRRGLDVEGDTLLAVVAINLVDSKPPQQILKDPRHELVGPHARRLLLHDGAGGVRDPEVCELLRVRDEAREGREAGRQRGDLLAGGVDQVGRQKGVDAAEGDPVAGDGVAGDEVAEMGVVCELKGCDGRVWVVGYRLAVAAVLDGQNNPLSLPTSAGTSPLQQLLGSERTRDAAADDDDVRGRRQVSCGPVAEQRLGWLAVPVRRRALGRGQVGLARLESFACHCFAVEG